jgi:hypothetical protein
VVKEKEMRRFVFLVAVVVLTVFSASSVQAAINVTYTVNTDANKTPISKYIYGSNWGNNTNYTIQRTGGNRCTAYNWENNWSNAGSDWYFENDQMFDPNETPGEGITMAIDKYNSLGQESIITLQLAGYVSAPIFAMNLNNYPAPSQYFIPVQFAKGAPFCSPPGNPNKNDGVVYMDEFVNFLVSRYGHAGSPGAVKFYSLDNEVDCWQATHYEVHPALPGAKEVKDKGIACATAVKNVDPNAQILGPDMMGFSGYLSIGNDWATEANGRPWYISYYLDEMRIASQAAGKRLLDVLDVHWYPEAQDGAGHRILDGSINTPQMYNARMQAPRTLWDTGYVYPNNTYPNGEVSWINQWYFAQYLPILTRFKADIQNYYPDTNISITEYSYGPETHWSTGIATTDFLGICGKYGVYIATYWGEGTYVDAAIKMFRKYDFRTNATFGDMNVPATMSNKVDSSIYASIFDSNNNVLHLIVINKNFDNDINGTFNITSAHNFTSGRIWAFDVNGYNIRERIAISNITSNSFKYTVPKLSVCHIVLDGPPCPLQYELTNDCYVDIDDLDVLAGQWLDPSHCPGVGCADLNGDGQINFKDFALLGHEWKL